MKKTIPEYTPVDLSCWARKEHFEVFQTFAQSTFNQTVLLDITALLKHIKEVGWKFYPTIIFLLSKVVNRHTEFRMAIKDNELVIWNEVHPSYTIFHNETETFSSLWSHYDGNIHHFQHVYAEDMARYGNNLSYWPKGESLENIFFVSAIPWVSFTSFNINVANMQNFFSPMFTIGKYYNQDGKVMLPLAVQVHHSVCDGFHVARLINELQEISDNILHHSEERNA
ncbi:type A chloramphenicol O-acetyltransferase [Citrobacter sp. C348]|jgi:chloramphenicol O-acetyltransferase type A|uniref:Chloramphenicol acetyltransferase n=2 Tax=Citrobacter freundii complex TaxID=1344959 RepID=A0ABD7AZ17_CITFR|nr:MULTISPECIES: type A chloramphenicol O-acetyltransferase [Citrobacter freundii complex]NTZ50614.1 type A chloramphenicol O-acetyltransferase [Citrobacter gillenii]QLW74815.1 type A chloramphenicol O-acetyltransferase [Citrobacter freundii]QLX25633.1 type A chloramphenicol O-acetyltransferase [Citrobacter freundii]QLY37131.1 type A chloramphenicol O-acetyltransferase [Citrobacter freundii]QLZ59851.1 type A chloramphenicol O-acetyltransferase [Citrobacter freundii]